MKKTFLLLTLALFVFQACSPAKMLHNSDRQQKGYSLIYLQKTKTETTTEVMGTTQNQSSVNAVEYKIDLTDILADGNLQWIATFTKVYYESEDAEGNVFEYDSTNPEQDTTEMRNRIFGSMTGKSMSMITNRQGSIVSISGASALFDGIIEETKGLPGMEGLAASLKSAYGDSAMMESFSNIWGFYPRKPIRVGQKWTIERKNTGFIAMNAKYAYTLKSRDEKQAVLTTKSSVKTKPGAQLDLGFAQIIYDMSGKGTGESILTQPDGVLQQATHTLNVSGIMHMSGAGMPDMDIPITTTTTVTIKLINQL